MKPNHHDHSAHHGIFIPDTTSPEARENDAAAADAIAKLEPTNLAAHLFRVIANLAQSLSGYRPERLRQMLDLFDGGHEANTATACGCPSCMIRLDYIRMLGRPLLDAVLRVFEAAEVMKPRLDARAERVERVSKAKGRIGTELIQLAERGKLGWS